MLGSPPLTWGQLRGGPAGITVAPAGNRAVGAKTARMCVAATDSGECLPRWRHGLTFHISAPAARRAVHTQAATVPHPAVGGDEALPHWGRGFAVIVIAPAEYSPVLAQPACAVPADADGGEYILLRGSALAAVVPASADHPAASFSSRLVTLACGRDVNDGTSAMTLAHGLARQLAV